MAQQQYISRLDTFEDVTGISIKSKDVQKDTIPKELDGYLEIFSKDKAITLPFIYL